MGLKSTPQRYGTVAVTIHWLTALLILSLLILGVSADNASDDSLRRPLLTAHIGLGITVLLLTLLRILWWIFADRRPDHAPDMPPVQARIANGVHFLIYGFIIALAASGIATNILSGMIPALTSGGPLPDLDDIAPRAAHGLLAWSFTALLAVHIGAALYHHFIRRDGLLARMGIGGR